MARQDARPKTARPPWRQLYATYRLIRTVASLPYWIIMALVSRPQNWTFKQAVLTAFFRDYVDQFSLAGVNAPASLEPGKEGDRWKVIDPSGFPPASYQGPATCTDVTPAKVGGTWHPAEPKSPTGPVFLWIHGGAFVMGDARDSFSGFAGKTLVEHAGAAAVFCVEYRLSGYGQNPFPAAFQDIITAYLYLTSTLQIPAAQITVGGDSAGGNLALAFVRYVEAHGAAAGVARPASVALASPWVSPLDTLDPACACAWETERNYTRDYLPKAFLQWGATTYPPTAGIDEAVRGYITPLGHAFATKVPMIVWYGENEMLRPGIVAFVEQMQGVAGNTVEVFCEKDAIHDTIIIGNVLGWEESAKEVAAKVGTFVRENQTSVVQ